MSMGTFTVNLNTILQALILFALLGGVRGIYTKLKELADKITLTNGNIIKLQTWKTEHEKSEKEHYDEFKADRKTLWEKMDTLISKAK